MSVGAQPRVRLPKPPSLNEIPKPFNSDLYLPTNVVIELEIVRSLKMLNLIRFQRNKMMKSNKL